MNFYCRLEANEIVKIQDKNPRGNPFAIGVYPLYLANDDQEFDRKKWTDKLFIKEISVQFETKEIEIRRPIGVGVESTLSGILIKEGTKWKFFINNS